MPVPYVPGIVQARRRLIWGAVALATVVSIASAGCGEEPEEISESELPAPLARALGELEREGYDVRALAIGPLDVPMVLVEGDQPVVVATNRSAHAAGSGVLVALNEFSDQELDGATEFVCQELLVAGTVGPDLRLVAKAIRECADTV